ncbi:MAG: mannose-1-phosphate guanylyltransferase [Cytophagales bacterium]|nr:mannose-1-phosphate guanylyltransferase [Bernardetiaceae bacterium]MDW8205921.1 mannose-1-phosphate guanylyltransferase [Cytophagales bacterium]
MNKHYYVIVMAGGIGTRFWPFSRVERPKQFQDILGIGQTLLQMTVKRFRKICPISNIYVVTNQTYGALVREQLPELSEEQILLEPFMRNTAPCVAYGAYKIAKKDPQAVIVVAPSDHVILHQDKFEEAITTALRAAQKHDAIITLGITPTRADTGYGYINIEEQLLVEDVYKVRTFTEKPNAEIAQAFLDSGDYVWNAGIFIWHNRTILQAFRRHLPEIHEVFETITPKFYTEEEAQAVYWAYERCRSVSIDYGIMEHADNTYVVPCNLGWSDLGTWKSLYEYLPHDTNNNVLSGNIITYDTFNSLIKSSSERLLVVQGMNNYIIVEHENVLLICHKDSEQQIKYILDDVREQKGAEFL